MVYMHGICLQQSPLVEEEYGGGEDRQGLERVEADDTVPQQ